MSLPVETSRRIWERPIDRRQFISKGSIAIGVAIGVPDIFATALMLAQQARKDLPLPMAPEVSSDLGREVERKFNIRLSDGRAEQDPVQWTTTSLAILATNLSYAPKEMLAPKNGRQLDVMITNHPVSVVHEGLDIEASYVFDPDHPFNMGIVKVKPKRLTREFLAYSSEDQYHELGHMANMTRGLVPQDAMFGAIGQTFENFAPEVMAATEPFLHIDTTHSKSNFNLAHTAGRLQLAVSAPAEFPAVIAEMYIRGRAGFNILNTWLQAPLVDKLYKINKELVYSGVEYSGKHTFTEALRFNSAGNVIHAPVLGI